MPMKMAELEFISREDFRKNQSGFIKSLLREYSKYYIIPEGGTNDLAVKGVKKYFVIMIWFWYLL